MKDDESEDSLQQVKRKKLKRKKVMCSNLRASKDLLQECLLKVLKKIITLLSFQKKNPYLDSDDEDKAFESITSGKKVS